MKPTQYDFDRITSLAFFPLGYTSQLEFMSTPKSQAEQIKEYNGCRR